MHPWKQIFSAKELGFMDNELEINVFFLREYTNVSIICDELVVKMSSLQ